MFTIPPDPRYAPTGGADPPIRAATLPRPGPLGTGDGAEPVPREALVSGHFLCQVPYTQIGH
jgi:hypothetical protein